MYSQTLSLPESLNLSSKDATYQNGGQIWHWHCFKYWCVQLLVAVHTGRLRTYLRSGKIKLSNTLVSSLLNPAYPGYPVNKLNPIISCKQAES